MVTSPSHATVITFDADPNVAKVNNLLNFLGNSVTEQGYTFTDTNQFASYGSLSTNFVGKTTLFDNQVNAPTTLTLTLGGGGQFNFTAIDVANAVHQNPVTTLAPITFTGHVHGGGIVTETFSSIAANNTLQTLTLNSGFSNLDSVSWTEPNGTNPLYAWTDVNVTQAVQTVPEPGSLAVFGAGLLGLVYLKRRRIADKSVRTSVA
jgi:hypothetical protein